MESGNDRRQFGFVDFLTVLSFVIAIENLEENRIQSAHNDVQAANAKQEQHLLKEIRKMFEEQNQMLGEILEQLKN